MIVHQFGQPAKAAEFIQRSLIVKPSNATAHNNLGNALRDLGRAKDAYTSYRRAVALKPDFAGAYSNMGNVQKDHGRLEEAISLYRTAVDFDPNYAQAHCNLGNALREASALEESAAACRRAIAIQPEFAEAYNNLGNALRDQKLPDEAADAYRRAIEIQRNLAEAHNNLGDVLKDVGRLDDALAEFRTAIQLRPNYAEAHSNLLYALHFHPTMSAEKIADEHRRWNAEQAEPFRAAARAHDNDPSPERRLRIGYVSPDFRDHCQAFFMLPLLAGHKRRDEVDVICYSDVLRPDARTEELKQLATAWRPIVGQSDAQLAELIRADGIDLLVDLTMHMARNRLLAFARRPAPVQVTWLAYPASTGLTAIDYRLSDSHFDPPGTDESIYSEKTIRLPETFWCYAPFDGEDLPLNPPPAMESGAITFGCLNNPCKFNLPLLKLWAKVLHRVTNARLMLLAPSADHRRRILAGFTSEQIDPSRIEFVPYQPRPAYLQLYNRIDIGLDSFPYNGHTTSLDSYWMGVPVVTRVGERAVSRGGLSQLSNLGLTELAASTDAEFVSIATRLANDLPRLSLLRSTLRDRMLRSPLMDAARFTGHIENTFREMFRTWCVQGGRG